MMSEPRRTGDEIPYRPEPATDIPSAPPVLQSDLPAMPAAFSYAKLLPVLLLIGSNLFMTVAWYWHLRFKQVPLAAVIFVSWALAFVEYCLAVPANRYGYGAYTAAQLKTIQEVVTLTIFAVFSAVYLKEPLAWNHAIGFALIAAGAFFVFQKW
jgi:uncharacterized protein